ncbi:hypothetical protein KY309_00565 [Candidatus Woesearchaeota archaeon]|nr:hypothetical protein [Candidatus Woesearchaeota archaeon]MBW3016086.1 hypothetical protein [Candidatus Woesearchaeota archaeon]
MSLAASLAEAAPIYNLGFVVIVLILFYKLFSIPVKDRRIYLLPWKIILFAVIVFIIEEAITVLRMAGILNIPIHIYGFFELLIVCTFIYMLLLQKQHIKKVKR